MEIFVINAILIVVWKILLDFLKLSKRKKYFCILCFLQLVIFFAFRNWVVGKEGSLADLQLYNRYYAQLKELSIVESIKFNNSKSMLFYLIMSLVSKTGLSFNGFITLLSIVYYFFVVRHIYKYSSNMFLSILIFLGTGGFVASFYLLRQIMAIIFGLIAFDFFCRKKYYRFLLFLAASCLTHFSAIALIPLFVVLKIRNKKLSYAVCLLIVAIFIIFRNSLAQIIISLTRTNYIGYYDSNIKLGSLAIMLLIYLFFVYWIHYLEKKEIQHNCMDLMNSYHKPVKYNSLLVMCLLCLIQICSSYSYTFTRLNYFYFVIAFTIIVPEITKYSRANNKKTVMVKKAIIACTIILMCYLYFNGVIAEGLDNIDNFCF